MRLYSVDLHIAGLCEDPKEVLCGNYTEIVDVDGANIVKGLVLWEAPGSALFKNATLGM